MEKTNDSHLSEEEISYLKQQNYWENPHIPFDPIFGVTDEVWEKAKPKLSNFFGNIIIFGTTGDLKSDELMELRKL